MRMHDNEEKRIENIAILASWDLTMNVGNVFIPSTHYLYLKYVSTYFNKVYLISPIGNKNTKKEGEILDFKNVEIIPLPPSSSYLKAMSHWAAYRNAIKSIVDKVDCFYCRVPDPFSWMPALLYKKKTIMHFVGDTIDTTKHNEKWPWLKKKVMITGYLPEFWLTLKAARRSTVYTNGPHIKDRLANHNIKATSVISSTVFKKDLHSDFNPLPINNNSLIFTYIGYIRFAKGMNCLLDFCKEMKRRGINYVFHIIGDGEMMEDVKIFIKKELLEEKIILHGHISNRTEINEILRGSDLFFFPSLSEGSPRVIIEAMAQGVPVMSTPVGALPKTFSNGETIRFFDFNDVNGAIKIVQEYIKDVKPFEKQREVAFRKVCENFTIEKFLSKVFSYEP